MKLKILLGLLVAATLAVAGCNANEDYSASYDGYSASVQVTTNGVTVDGSAPVGTNTASGIVTITK